MNRHDYQNKWLDLLSDTENYQKLNKDPLSTLIRKFNAIINKHPPSDIKQSIKEKHPTLSNIYDVPKIHKPITLANKEKKTLEQQLPILFRQTLLYKFLVSVSPGFR